MLTPNGRFKPNRRLCLSMSDFHPESWNPMWSISTILTGLYSFMVEKTPTTGSIETSIATKRRLARESLDWNVKERMFCNLFPEYVEIWKEREEERKKKEEEALARGEVVAEKKVTSSDDGVVGRGDLLLVKFAAAIVVALMSITFLLNSFRII